MMKELPDEVKGIAIWGQNLTNLRYADDAVFVSDEEAELKWVSRYLDSIVVSPTTTWEWVTRGQYNSQTRQVVDDLSQLWPILRYKWQIVQSAH